MKGLEKVMQYMWQWRLYGSPDKSLTDGRRLRIIHPGTLNTASGPDFFNAKLIIDGTEWAGNVELHLRASDWHRHSHHLDRAYDSVILHVVGENDGYVRRPDGAIIPQLHLPFSRELAERYATLAGNASPLRCRAHIAGVHPLFLRDAIDSCAMERLRGKAARVAEALSATGHDWAHATFITLARAIGAGINAEPCETLGRLLPPGLAGKHADSLFQLEALTLGVAGLLENCTRPDDYFRSLAGEWQFLSHKYGLRSMAPHLWKFSGSRPAASPLRRLVYLSRLMRKGNALLSELLDTEGDLNQLHDFFTLRHEGYWSRRLTFGPESTRNYSSAIGRSTVNSLLINAVAPLYYAYGTHTGNLRYHDMASDLLHSLDAESNSIIRMWTSCTQVRPADAWETQGLLQLTHSYCRPGNCLRCRIAHQSLRHSLNYPSTQNPL